MADLPSATSDHYRYPLGYSQAVADNGCFHDIFSRIAKLPSDGSAPYALMVFAAMLPWTLFSSALGEASNSLISTQFLLANLLSTINNSNCYNCNRFC